MKAFVLQRTSAAKAGWIIGLIFFAWLAFLFVPYPRKPAPAAPPTISAAPPSRLKAVGLPDYPEWDALPDQFAIWAEHAEWTGNTTRFAYWNPGANDYAYFFEATRTPQGYRFKEIGKPKEYRAYESQFSDRVPQADEHPLLLIRPKAWRPAAEKARPPAVPVPESASPPPSVPVELPKPELQKPPADVQLSAPPKSEPPKRPAG